MGGNAGVWKDVFSATGGFDTEWRAGDDWEFAFRAQVAGFRVAFASDAVMAVRFRQSAGANLRQRFRYGLTDARLASRFRRDGLRTPGLAQGLRVWASIVRQLPAVMAGGDARDRLLIRVGTHTGRLVGSFRYGVVFL
jgi:GT2 family glycosyltransferase